MSGVLGIDLGTTNSCASLMEGEAPLVLPMADGKYTLPSVVAFKAGRVLVGERAKRQSATNAASTIFAAKRLMGRSFSDPETQRAIENVPYRCIAGPTGDVNIVLDDKAFAVEEISALILGTMKRAAERHLQREVRQAVIACPAYFNDRQRQATRDAGMIAGLEVIQIVNEPTAAALAHGFHQGASRRVVVYDLGGGTFDVSVLRVGGGAVEVLATAGDAFLGGHDFDNRIFDWLVGRVAETHGVNVAEDADVSQRLREAAEAAKIRLSESERTTIAVPFLTTAKGGEPVHLECALDRALFESLTGDLVERSVTLFKETIQAAGLTPEAIQEVLLVGGMTRMPAVRARVAELVACPPSFNVHPDLVVAVGASVQAALLTNDAASAVLVDVTPHNLGIMTVAGLAETVIPKNTRIPTAVERRFSTVSDGQQVVKIVVYQGDSRKLAQNQVLGEFYLQGIRPAPRGDVKIDVRFAISADGTVQVTAIDVETKNAKELRIVRGSGRPPGELERMISQHQELLLATEGADST
ncbi:MAG: Hsp70 family protein [Deltaproteobacteria bacterium]|nr:Hsp70 family protein [Deltaproteobacteria bacterium]